MGIKLSELSGVVDSFDDCLLLLSYSVDDGASYTTTRIRVADLFDDIDLGDLKNVGTATPNSGDVLSWSNSTSSWEPAAPTGGGGTAELGPILESNRVISEDITLGTNKNGFSAGAVEVTDGATVTVPETSDWQINNGPKRTGVIAEMLNVINSDFSIAHHSNGLSYDYVAIGGSATVTIPSTSTWRIL
ncbi:predicted protein [Cyanophage PSS2]|uniref:hypothetical protein n=1 Tax=Cyanophage PSS2 TaxID=658401 RepID=UPI0001B0401D|nr:hypothetical protein PSS2_gp071 [Cyanophage PSS2]ACT65633.1 hypothetical protein [Cyanophage PSS2]ACY75775.1 predicted protein [Cyanophage PSS2]